MLNKDYHQLILGKNYISLIFGILEQNQNKQSLIVNNEQVSQTSIWQVNIGELERKLLVHIGQENRIDGLINLDNYIERTNNLIYLNDTCIELSGSPYLNLKEMMRKFPVSFLNIFKEFFENVSETDFNTEFSEFEDYLMTLSGRPRFDKIIKSKTYSIISDCLKNYLSFLVAEEGYSKQLNHILQIIFQVRFSSHLSQDDCLYLFLSLLSPRYVINEKKLSSELLFQFRKLGGDIKNTNIKNWGINNSSLKHVLLNSIDGVIGLESAKIFSSPHESLPFLSNQNGNKYLSIHFSCPVNNDFLEFYAGKRIVISQNERVGGDFPYWEYRINNAGEVEGVYAYIESQGSKASFFYHQVVEDVYLSLQNLLPGL